MPTVSKSRIRPRRELERAVVAPLFESVKSLTPTDATLPLVVFEHRRRRARERLLDALVSRGSEQVPAQLLEEMKLLVRDWATSAFDDGFELATRFEIRCAREHDLVVAQESGDPEKLLTVLEQDHRRRVIEQFGKIELRGIQTSHRVLQDLDIVYVPLHLEVQSEIYTDGAGNTYHVRLHERLPVLPVLNDHFHVLIVGTPGSGKSTLVAYFATRAAAQELGTKWGGLLPLVITVRSFKAHSLTANSIASHVGCPVDLVRQVLRQGRALIFLDGLDEAPEELRDQLVKSVHRFIRYYPTIRLLATSRPAGAPGEIERKVHGLKPFRLSDLQHQEVDEYISRWCIAAERSLRKDLTEADKEAKKAAEDLKRRLSQSYSVQRIAVNPLLVTILCVVHRFLGRSIPEHRVTLYEKCTDALLYEWDRAKFPEGSAVGYLDASTKRQLLMGVARNVHLKHAAEIAEKDVIQHFQTILPQLGRPANDAARIVAEIRDRSGLLIERRPGFFAFSHLTFQEYLCALYFAEANDIGGLIKHYADPWWHEVIVLAAGSPGVEAGKIARHLLSIKNRAGIFLASQCLETAIAMPLEIRQRIEARIKELIPPRNFESAEGLVRLGIVAAPALAQALRNSPNERPFILTALEQIDYEPAVPVIAQCMNDKRPSFIAIHLTEGRLRKGRSWSLSVGAFAAFILAHKALTSSTARLALRGVRDYLSPEELTEFSVYLKQEPTLHTISVELGLGTSPSRRARNTA